MLKTQSRSSQKRFPAVIPPQSRVFGFFYGLAKTKSEFEHGKVQKIVGFENGEETILEEYKYYENGQLKSKWNFKDGKEHGLQKEYYRNGQLRHKTNYKNGVEIKE